MGNKKANKFDQKNLPNGGFLQSKEWREFQKSVGRKVYEVSCEKFYASVIEHRLPIVGKYFYVPRGPVVKPLKVKAQISKGIQKLISLAEKNGVGWIRVEPASEKTLKIIQTQTPGRRIVRAPHDMQPKETLVLDITKSEEDILSQMKSKTRYNIKLAEKKGVKIHLISDLSKSSASNLPSGEASKISNEKYLNEFLKLVKITSKRGGISSHPEEYYRKMVAVLPEDMLSLYVAEYKNKIIAANLVIFYGGTSTYLHGASGDIYRNIMAPYLLQWRQIQDARRRRCARYDFFGIKLNPDSKGLYLKQEQNENFGKAKHKRIPDTNWAGITRFKLGFAPGARTLEFPGSYDIIVNPGKYWLYRGLQKAKSFAKFR